VLRFAAGFVGDRRDPGEAQRFDQDVRAFDPVFRVGLSLRVRARSGDHGQPRRPGARRGHGTERVDVARDIGVEDVSRTSRGVCDQLRESGVSGDRRAMADDDAPGPARFPQCVREGRFLCGFPGPLRDHEDQAQAAREFADRGRVRRGHLPVRDETGDGGALEASAVRRADVVIPDHGIEGRRRLRPRAAVVEGRRELRRRCDEGTEGARDVLDDAGDELFRAQSVRVEVVP